jgi:hypothetical protein
MRAIYEGSSQGLSGPVPSPVLEQALRHVREGLRLDPSSDFLQDMERSLEGLRQGSPSPPTPPQKITAPEEITI